MTAPASVTAAAHLVRALRERGQTVAVAESLTGGLVAAALTSIPGVSAVLRGGVVVYATDTKASVLGVDTDLLAREGAVHPLVAEQMAAGVARLMGATWGVATTGVAGPDPQDGHAVGEVYVAVSGPDGAVVSQRAEIDVPDGRDPLEGRALVRADAVLAALWLLQDRLEA